MLQSGIKLGGIYRLEKRIGRGGMGEVWLATHTLLKQPRAIKIMLGEIAANPKERERFISGEARNALELEAHPNLVRIYELGLHEDMPFIVMEYVKGGPQGATLKDWIRDQERLSPAEAANVLNKVSAALDAAHRQGIIHRDIKPGNILLTSENQPKLTDFGLTKDMDEEVDLTTTSESRGTPAYMSPEQAQGYPERRSDIYSLGVVLYEMLSGQLPFRGTITSILIQHATQPPPPLHQFVPWIPSPVETVIHKVLAKSPKDRFATASELATAFEQALKQAPSVNSTPPPKPLVRQSDPEQPTFDLGHWPAPTPPTAPQPAPAQSAPSPSDLEPFEDMIRSFFERGKQNPKPDEIVAKLTAQSANPPFANSYQGASSTPSSQKEVQLGEWAAQLALANFAGDWDRVIEIGELILRVEPQHAQTRQLTSGAYRTRGIGLYEKQYYKWAIADFNRAIQLEPNEADHYFWRAKSHFRQRSYDPNNQAMISRNRIFIEQALADCSHAIQLAPNVEEYYYVRSQINQAYGDEAAFRRDLEKAAQLGHTDAKRELAQLKGFWRRLFQG
jgi:serine/threonine-protein kinase